MTGKFFFGYLAVIVIGGILVFLIGSILGWA